MSELILNLTMVSFGNWRKDDSIIIDEPTIDNTIFPVVRHTKSSINFIAQSSVYKK